MSDGMVDESVDLVVIGGGSGGLSAAVSAYDSGVSNILVLEKNKDFGGILLQCIHNGFGLQRYKTDLTGPEYAHRAVVEAKKREGIVLQSEATVLKITPELEVHYSSAKTGYRIVKAGAIICATGCDERTRGAIRIPGDRPSGVMTAGLAQRYMNIEGFAVGKRFFILGSGDIGLIMARRVTLEGGDVLGVAELQPYSNGLTRNIFQCLDDFNIPLYLSHTVKSIHGKERLERIVLAQVDENYRFIPGTEKTFEVDALLLSVGLIPSNALLTSLGCKIHPKTDGAMVDESLQTSIPGVFSCGNSLHVHDLVDFVSMEGEIAGKSAARFLLSKREGVVNSVESTELIETVPLEGVSYLLPSILRPAQSDTFDLKFRVTRPFQNVNLLLKLNGQLLKKKKKNFLLPSEMENLRLTRDDFSSMSTVKKQIRIVTSPLRHAASLRLIPSDPTVGLKLPSSSCFEEKDVQAYTKEEQEKLSAVAKTYRYPGWAAVLLMIETGMRVGEALALRWRDVQIFNKRLYVNATIIRLANKNASRIQDSPKSKSSRRVIPLTNLAIKILEHQKMVSPGNFVFSDQNGNNLSYEALRYQVQKLASEAGVSYMGMHVFRHTFATNCYYKGVDVKILSRLLGHSNPSVTLNVYIHLYGDGFEEMYNAITS